MRQFLIGMLTAAVLCVLVFALTDKPVCHAQTEDSIIYDCDYRNGAWYQR